MEKKGYPKIQSLAANTLKERERDHTVYSSTKNAIISECHFAFEALGACSGNRRCSEDVMFLPLASPHCSVLF